ncbi:hypothetical protein KUTeg_022151 [Tegillarca granosa]|uniref:Uncharacterized protein n=1 Tax=Tegillarca granosa TaxID=220873 RepID=A0ABQ9E9S3_TEGGR|nr:hypothetical protein KUTeg_022151 [Tegillarca granosa]
MERFLIILSLITYTYAFCYSSNGRIDKTASGQMIPVCEYNGLDLLDGSSFKTAGCVECNCHKGILHCCGYGINAGVIEPPVGCKVIADGCSPVFVMATDPTRDCYTGSPVAFDKKPLPGMVSPTGNQPTMDPFTEALIMQLAGNTPKGNIDPLISALSGQLLGGSNAQGNTIMDMSSSSQPQESPKQTDKMLSNLLLLRGMTEL